MPRARRRLAAITGSKFRIQSGGKLATRSWQARNLMASSQHVGAAAAVTNLQLEFMLVEQ